MKAARTPWSAFVLCACAGSSPVDWPRPAPTVLIANEDAIADQARLEQAYRALEAAPRDEAAIVWYGRRLAYCGHYDQAIDVYTRGLGLHPDSPRLLRHRGHRLITVRRFADAERDLARAAELLAGTPDEIEPDGKPNARNVPTSTLHTNVWYHLGLARYLQRDFQGADHAYERCLAAATNPDMEVASRYWLCLSLDRAGRPDAARAAVAPVRDDLDILENHAYWRLCLLYRRALGIDAFGGGEAGTVNAGTLGYGLARWHFMQGDAERGRAALREVVRHGPPAAFGCIAAEVDLDEASARR